MVIRGSVPIFWEQKGMVENIEVTRDSNQTREAFNTHFDRTIRNYGNVLCVDLLSDSKAREIKLTKEYVKQVFESPFSK